MRITDLLSKESIRLDGVSSTKKETIRAMADLMENKGVSAYVAVLAALLIGLAFGIVQGFLVTYMGIQPFIVTLAGMFFARGMTAVICKEQVSIVSDKIFTTLSSFKISLPFGGYLNKKGIMQFPYLRVTVVVAS